jgi:hypothetical protein
MPYVDGLPFLVAGALLIINAVQQFSAKAEVRWAQTTWKTVEFRLPSGGKSMGKSWDFTKKNGDFTNKWWYHGGNIGDRMGIYNMVRYLSIYLSKYIYIMGI